MTRYLENKVNKASDLKAYQVPSSISTNKPIGLSHCSVLQYTEDKAKILKETGRKQENVMTKNSN